MKQLMPECVQLAWDELVRAQAKFADFASHHEGYAVILEELDELFDAIKANDPVQAHKEAVQVAAMAMRFVNDLYPGTNLKSIKPKGESHG